MVTLESDSGSKTFVCRVNSRPTTPVGGMQLFKIVMGKNGSINLSIPLFKEVSIFVLMRALGLRTDREIVEAVLDPESDADARISIILSTAMNLDVNK